MENDDCLTEEFEKIWGYSVDDEEGIRFKIFEDEEEALEFAKDKYYVYFGIMTFDKSDFENSEYELIYDPFEDEVEYSEGICPTCAGHNIQYYDVEAVSSEEVDMLWECLECMSRGKERHSIWFKKHLGRTDENTHLENVCPACNYDTLDYDDMFFKSQENEICYPWTCPNCGETGEEAFYHEFNTIRKNSPAS